MSFDFGIRMPDGSYKEPSFNDRHPEIDNSGFAGNAVVNEHGYSRCGNYTYNVSPIFYRVLTHAFGVETGFRSLHERKCSDIAAKVHEAVKWGIANLSELRTMNPKNGWGSADGALVYLWDVARMCDEYPDGTLVIS